MLTEKEVRQIVREEGDTRYRLVEDCDEISSEVKEDLSAVITDVAVVKSTLKGILAVAMIVAGFLIPACLKIILGG